MKVQNAILLFEISKTKLSTSSIIFIQNITGIQKHPGNLASQNGFLDIFMMLASFLKRSIHAILEKGSCRKQLQIQPISKSPSKILQSSAYKPVYNSKDWMSTMAFANFWSLVLPGSHDSFTYTFKNYLPPQIKVMIQTQNMSITEQLNLGVRYFDIRLCSWQENILKERVYYTSHSCLCTPLDSVFGQIKEFLMTQTSEIVVISLRADFFPMNLDLFTGNTDIVHALDIKDKQHKGNLRDFAESYFQDTIGVIKEITPTTRVKDLQMANQRVLIFVEYEASFSQTISSNPIYLYSSWELTQSTDPQDNHALCADWLKRRPLKTIDYWKTLDHQVTFESQNILEIAKDVFYYSDGLKGMALASNQLIREYLGDSTNSDSIMKVNAITMDFADKETIESIINANFKYL